MSTKDFGANLQELTKSIDVAAELQLKKIGTYLAEQLRVARERQQLSQTDLAKLLGTGQSRISQMEDPQYGKVSLSSLAKASVCLDCELVIDLRYQGDADRQSEVVSEYRILNDLLQRDPEFLADAMKHNAPQVHESIAEYSVPAKHSQADNIALSKEKTANKKWVA